jgi:type IV pilus assembly protein PilC
MLKDIADFHDEEVDHSVKILTNLIEPALMIIMGLVIGTIVVLLYLPIFMLGQAI